jgi:hypothetical protein
MILGTLNTFTNLVLVGLFRERNPDAATIDIRLVYNSTHTEMPRSGRDLLRVSGMILFPSRWSLSNYIRLDNQEDILVVARLAQRFRQTIGAACLANVLRATTPQEDPS